MGEVSVVGLGAMGSSLAKALLDKGHRVTIWNRTISKASPLAALGASVAGSPASAIEASSVIFVCVDNYEVMLDVVGANECVAAIKGKTLINLSSGIPSDARNAEKVLKSMGAEYLDGAILAYPEHIGSPDAAIFVSGPEEVFHSAQHLICDLAGGTTYVGAAIGKASALDSGMLCTLIGAYLGAIHGARICEVEELSVTEFGAMLAELMPVLGQEITHISQRISAASFDNTQAALKTYAAVARRFVRQAEESNINVAFPSYAANILELAESENLGNKDLAALINVLRTAPNEAMEAET